MYLAVYIYGPIYIYIYIYMCVLHLYIMAYTTFRTKYDSEYVMRWRGDDPFNSVDSRSIGQSSKQDGFIQLLGSTVIKSTK